MERRRRRSTKLLPEQIRTVAKKPPQKASTVEFISTGSIILNLAASQKGRDGGWARGRINNIVGDGSSGKTLLALEACAWAFYNIEKIKSDLFSKVKKVIIVYNNIEGVMDFPIPEMYGQRFHDSVEWIQSETCEEFGRDYQRRVKALRSDEFLLYVLDSIDATIAKAAKERIEKAIKTDKEEDGSYGTEKAKYFSGAFFNQLCSIMEKKNETMEKKDATLILISQVRDKIGVTFGKKKYRTGGKALDFYTHQVAWLYEKKKLKKTFRSQERVYGIRVVAKWERNKTAKPFREEEFTILFDYGLDDIGTMLDYLYGPEAKEIEWNDKKNKKLELVDLIENDSGEYDKLVDLVEQDWNEIEEKIMPKRKRRFNA